jgi:FkbM family methyltransferase
MIKTFTTPGGNRAEFEVRAGTNDAMVAEAVVRHDEYALAELPQAGGRYIDIGSHIGSWIIAALLDDQWAEGVAVEAVPDNVELLTANLELNGLTDRVEVVPKAFARRGPVSISYDLDREGEDERARMAEMHRFIGNQRMSEGTNGTTIKVPAITPRALFKDGAAAVKIDIEGGEEALIGASLKGVGVITGEYHIDRGPLFDHLTKTHRVGLSGSQSFGYFTAVPR